MKTNETQLRQMFVTATDEVVPPAPWLEAHVVDAVRRRARTRRRIIDVAALAGFGPSLRLTAGVVAILVAVVAVAALLMSARLLHHSTVPGGRSSTVQTPEGSIIPFIPSPAVRAATWPAGGPVPAELTGSWQKSQLTPTLHLAGYTFQLGEERNGPNINPAAFGNVVVNGSEIDFISDACTADAQPGLERYTYSLSGNVLVLTRLLVPGQANCSDQGPWPNFAGTYSRVPAG
jgi:hypothetical protein